MKGEREVRREVAKDVAIRAFLARDRLLVWQGQEIRRVGNESDAAGREISEVDRAAELSGMEAMLDARPPAVHRHSADGREAEVAGGRRWQRIALRGGDARGDRDGTEENREHSSRRKAVEHSSSGGRSGTTGVRAG